MITNEQVIDTLKKVYDPGIAANIYELGLIYDVKAIENEVFIIMTHALPCYPPAFKPDKIKNAIYKIPAVKKVNIDLAYIPDLTFAKIKNSIQYNI